MILCCSAGCHCDMDGFTSGKGTGWLMQHSAWQIKKVGDKCPEGCWNGIGFRTTYCGRKLFDLDKRVEKLYSRLFSHRISGNDPRLNRMTWKNLERGVDTREVIRKLILEGKRPATGYFCTSIRELHSPVILHLR